MLSHISTFLVYFRSVTEDGNNKKNFHLIEIVFIQINFTMPKFLFYNNDCLNS